MAIERKKTSLFLDVQLVQAAKVLAANSGRRDYQVFEDALRQYVSSHQEQTGKSLRQLFRDIAERQEREGVPLLTDDEAMALANDEVHAYRRERRETEQRRAQQG